MKTETIQCLVLMSMRTSQTPQKAKEAYAATVASIIQAISPDLIAAMQANSNAETIQHVSKAIEHPAIAKNEGVAETINTLLRGTSSENVFDNLVKNYGRVDK